MSENLCPVWKPLLLVLCLTLNLFSRLGSRKTHISLSLFTVSRPPCCLRHWRQTCFCYLPNNINPRQRRAANRGLTVLFFQTCLGYLEHLKKKKKTRFWKCVKCHVFDKILELNKSKEDDSMQFKGFCAFCSRMRLQMTNWLLTSLFFTVILWIYREPAEKRKR